MCYINSVLQLLASSDACINQCNNVKGVVANLLSSMRAGICSTSNMDCLLSHDVFQGEKRMFKLGEPNCAIEFMNWCVEEIQLNYNPTAITQTLIEQQCTTCKRTCLVKVKGGPYGRGNGSCLELVSGKAVTDRSEFDDRIQDCWRNDCPSANSLSGNLVRFREIRLHGEVVIYYWNAPCVQLQLQRYIFLTVNPQRKKRLKYRLCGFTVFESSKRHYITYRYVSDKLYCCDDYDIRISNHSRVFPTADKRCVMVIYEMVDVNNEVVRTQDVSKRRSKCFRKESLDKSGNRPVPIPSLISTTSVKPSAVTGDGLPHHWTAVNGDGFCWIYAFLVAVGILDSRDFPHGNAASGSPSTRALRFSRAIAPYAFRACDDVTYPEYENGKFESMGTFGGAPHFMRLLERIRPSFRFFILDHTHTWVKRALIMKEPRTNDVTLVSDHGTDLTSVCGTFVSNTYSVDYTSGYGAEPLQMIYDDTTTLPPHGKYVVHDDTDVVICWESERHFNALSRPRPELTTKSFLDTILSSPEQVSELFPPSNDTTYDYRDSDSDVELVSPPSHRQHTSRPLLRKQSPPNDTLYTCNESDSDV